MKIAIRKSVANFLSYIFLLNISWIGWEVIYQIRWNKAK